MKMPENLENVRDELSDKYFNRNKHPLDGEDPVCTWYDGFNACFEQMAPLIDALGMYAEPLSWETRSGKVGITFLTDGSDATTVNGKLVNGGAARRALKKVLGDE